jgi:hypothetical protein
MTTELELKSDPRGIWCVQYSKKDEPTVWNTMKLIRSDGIMVSAKTYDDVFKFVKYQDAWAFVKKLVTDPQPKYNVNIKKVCRARKNAFYLVGG